ncbi:MAG TPA: DUF4331 family protein, partial [Candidatus Baltobacteraceae bacterium]
MKALRALATIVASALLVFTISLYSLRTVRASDHQDSPTVVARPAADITDVFVYPAPDNAANVVLAMDVYPLIPSGMSANSMYSFDPAVLYQFKIASNIAGGTDYTAKEVIQFTVSGTGQSQTLTMHGPAAPNEPGIPNTVLPTTGSVPFGQATTL